MITKPAYEELERVNELKRVKKMENNAFDRKSAEEALHASEVSYRTLAENLPGLVYRVFILENNRMHFFNDQLQSMTGYKEEELKKGSACSIDPLILPEDVAGITTSVEEAIRKETPFEVEYRVTHRDGDIRYFWERGRPILGGDGKPQYIDGTIFDITERKQAEEALRESEERYRSLVEDQIELVSRIKSDGTFLYANNGYFHFFGKTKGVDEGSKWQPVAHPDDLPMIEEQLSRLCPENPVVSIENRVYDAKGKIRWVQFSNRAFFDEKGVIQEIQSVGRDVTERKRDEEALRESEERFRKIIENTEAGYFFIDQDGRFRNVNDAWLRMHKYSSSDEVIGKHFSLTQVDLEFNQVQEIATKSFSGESLLTGEFSRRCKDGSIGHHTFTLNPVIHGGKSIGVEGFLMDITKKKKLEAQLQETSKMEAIATLAGGIAHDYNNLLTVILGNLSIAQEEAEPSSAMAELLHEIEQASYKARDLTHQFLTLSQGGYPRKEPGSIESLLKEISGQVPADDGFKYTFVIKDDLWPLRYDSRQLHFAISNVLINAVEAMPQGGTITLQAENQVLENQHKKSALPLMEGRYVRISIKDEGRGIAEKHLSRIFDPYFSMKERGVEKGMGMGLSTAYAVVQKHGGHIEVNSTIGVGTTVTIYLPVAEEKGKEKSAKQVGDNIAPSISSGQPTIKRILVMDDEESLRNLAQRMLERLGYKVETVKSGVEAIETYKKHMDSGEPFDGIILDLTIKGGMGGDQAIKELIKIDPEVKAIVCSGYFDDPVMANYEEHGFRGALAKPFQKADLESVLKK